MVIEEEPPEDRATMYHELENPSPCSGSKRRRVNASTSVNSREIRGLIPEIGDILWAHADMKMDIEAAMKINWPQQLISTSKPPSGRSLVRARLIEITMRKRGGLSCRIN